MPRALIVYSTIVTGDAVGCDIIEQCRCLRDLGWDAGVYGEQIEPCLEEFFCPNPTRYLMDKDAVLIYHHAGFWHQGPQLVAGTKCKKILKYHNVTPEHYFLPYSVEFSRLCSAGRRQNQALRDLQWDLVLSDSEYNEQELIGLGFPAGQSRVLAPFHATSHLNDLDADVRRLDLLMDGKINVTFVGRVAPNKGFRNLIYTAHYFKRIFGTPVRFNFVGGVDPRLNGFFAEMNKLVQDLGVADIVEFTGRVPVSEIKAFYLASHVFLLTSEHEGFCVPILEAQFFKVPIVAVASTAIPQTLGDNQLLYPAVDFHVLASAIDIISRDPAVKLFLTAAGSRNFLKYETATLRRQFAAHLEALS